MTNINSILGAFKGIPLKQNDAVSTPQRQATTSNLARTPDQDTVELSSPKTKENLQPVISTSLADKLKGVAENAFARVLGNDPQNPTEIIQPETPAVDNRSPEQVRQETFPDGLPQYSQGEAEGAFSVMSQNPEGERIPITFEQVQAYADSQHLNGGSRTVAQNHENAENMITDLKLQDRAVFNSFAGENGVLELSDLNSLNMVSNPSFGEVGWEQSGGASWYGPGFDGRQTASGERFNQNDYTCAHQELPFGTRVQLTRDDGRSVVLRVNDRGPFAQGRIVDASAAGGRAIGLDQAGHAPVRLTIVPEDTPLGPV